MHTRFTIEAKSWYDDVIKWRDFPRYWPFVRGIHPSPLNSPHKGQWRGALMFFFICTWTISWVNNRYAGDLRRHHAHYDVTIMRPEIFEMQKRRHSSPIKSASTPLNLSIRWRRNIYLWRHNGPGVMRAFLKIKPGLLPYICIRIVLNYRTCLAGQTISDWIERHFLNCRISPNCQC